MDREKVTNFWEVGNFESELFIAMIIPFLWQLYLNERSFQIFKPSYRNQENYSLVKTIFYFLPNIKVEYPTCI